MKPAHANLVESLTDTQRLIVELGRVGVEIRSGRGKTVSVMTLYSAVCRATKVKARMDGNVAAQWEFMRRWLAVRSAAVAAPRGPMSTREYVVPREMREALARCAELDGRVSRV